MMITFADGTVTVMPIDPDSIVQFIRFVHAHFPVVGLMLLTILADIAFGLCAACMTRTLSSTISQKGMIKKAVQILWAGLGYAIEPYAGGLPMSGMVGMCFVVTNMISIMENSVRCGVPVPQPVMDVLAQLRSDKQAAEAVTKTTPSVVIDKASHVDVHTQGDSVNIKPPVKKD